MGNAAGTKRPDTENGECPVRLTNHLANNHKKGKGVAADQVQTVVTIKPISALVSLSFPSYPL